MKNKKLILIFMLIFTGTIKASEKSREAEEIFKEVGMPFDLAFTQKNPFGIDVIIFFVEGFALVYQRLIDNVYAAAINVKKIENDSDFDAVGAYNSTIEYMAYEYKKLFHFYLVHFYRLYDKEFDLDYVMKIDEVVATSFEQWAKEYIERKFQHRKALIHDLSNIFAKSLSN